MSDDDEDDMTICDACSREYPVNESATCSKCKAEFCPDCVTRSICDDCRDKKG
jgi:hypothetical protein